MHVLLKSYLSYRSAVKVPIFISDERQSEVCDFTYSTHSHKHIAGGQITVKDLTWQEN